MVAFLLVFPSNHESGQHECVEGGHTPRKAPFQSYTSSTRGMITQPTVLLGSGVPSQGQNLAARCSGPSGPCPRRRRFLSGRLDGYSESSRTNERMNECTDAEHCGPLERGFLDVLLSDKNTSLPLYPPEWFDPNLSIRILSTKVLVIFAGWGRASSGLPPWYVFNHGPGPMWF